MQWKTWMMENACIYDHHIDECDGAYVPPEDGDGDGEEEEESRPASYDRLEAFFNFCADNMIYYLWGDDANEAAICAEYGADSDTCAALQEWNGGDRDGIPIKVMKELAQRREQGAFSQFDENWLNNYNNDPAYTEVDLSAITVPIYYLSVPDEEGANGVASNKVVRSIPSTKNGFIFANEDTLFDKNLADLGLANDEFFELLTYGITSEDLSSDCTADQDFSSWTNI